MRYLNDSGRQAVQLAGELQQAMQHWLGQRGVSDSCTISPYVDQSGQPAVLIQMNTNVAHVMVASLTEPYRRVS